MSITLVLDSSKLNNVNTADFVVNFSPKLELGDGPWEMALVKAFMWYSFYNIDTEFNNTTARYSPDGGVTWKSFTILSGQYSIEQLNDRIQSIILSNGDNPANILILADFSTLKIQIVLVGGYQLDLTVSDLNLLLGFDKIIVTTTQLGSNVANINNGVNAIKISCDILTSSYDNSANSNVLYVDSPNTGPGSQIQWTQSERVYIPVIPQRYIQSIRTTFTDQTGKILNLQGESTTIWVHLRKMK